MLEAHSMKNKNHFISSDIDDLVSELTFYRNQSAKLKKVNELYRKIAGLTELGTMIETYSVWLSQHVPHRLIGYNNHAFRRTHLYCSNHGPEKRTAMKTAQKLIHKTDIDRERYFFIKGYHAYTWRFASGTDAGQFLLLRNGFGLTDEEFALINETLDILAPPLQKAIDFEQIFHQARKDALTGLPNRRVFDERIQSLMERARRHNHPLTLAAMDLDNFKKVNDTLGHQYGDTVLQKVAEALQNEIRMSDLLVRMGGDEFILILTDTDQRAGINLCQRLCRAVDDLDIPADGKKLGLSIGLSQWTPDLDKHQWLERADDVLYQMKARGGAGVAVN